MTRLIAIDLGEKRIGVALADDDGSAARPLVTLRRARDPQTDAGALQAIVTTHGADELVVGLPLDMSGDEGHQAEVTRGWATIVGAILHLPVIYRDERLSSSVAEARLGPMKRGRSGGPPSKTQRNAYRARVDREAAAVILQDELDTRAGLRSSVPHSPDPQESPR